MRRRPIHRGIRHGGSERLVRPRWRVTALLALVAVGPRAARAELDCTPQLQWTWDGSVRSPDHPQPCMTPLVVQLTDDDGDGRIDENDVPDVAFIHRGLTSGDPNGRLTAVDGLSGREHFTATFDPGLMGTGLAAADIDGDGVVELLAIESTGTRLVAFEADGSFKWTSDPVSRAFGSFDTIAVADLDQDGDAEILANAAVFGADGQLEWEGDRGRGTQFIGSVCHAVDLAPDSPGLEILAGNTLYDAAGGIVWRNGDVNDGWTAVADFDGDGDPEIAHVSIGAMNLLDRAGNPLTPTYFFGSTPASQPVAADLDGDGEAELFLMQADEVRALNLVGGAWSLLWSQPTEDPSRINGASAFDFDGDGTLDIVYHDMVEWHVFDGPTGEILHREPFRSATGIEVPVIADIDNDCVPEILVSGCSGALGPTYPNELRAYECSPAARARPTWNQYAYHVDNVLDDGSVPRFEQPPWLGHGSWMGQVSTAAGAIATAVAATPLRACAGEAVSLDASASTGCTGGYEYRFSQDGVPLRGWSPDPVLDVVADASPSHYTVHVRCSGEPCEDMADILVELDPRPIADAGPSREICVGSATRVGGNPTASGGSGGYAYLWTSSPPGAIAAGEDTSASPSTNPLHVPTELTVTVTDAAGCSDTASVFVDVVVPDLPRTVGDTLRVAKGSVQEDVLLRWSSDDPQAVAFRVHRGWPPAASYPVLGPDVVPRALGDAGILRNGQSYAYTVSGVNCEGVEGP